MSSRADAVAPSIAADDERPAPTGTSEANARSTPVTDAAARSGCVRAAPTRRPAGSAPTPATSSRRAGKSVVELGERHLDGVVVERRRDAHADTPSSRGVSATCVRCWIANGSTNPSL